MSEDKIEGDKKEKIKNWLKKALQSTWTWLKSNWLIVLIVGAVVVFAWRGCQKDDTYQNLFNRYKESIEEHQQQLDEIRSIQEEEQEARQKQYEQFLQEMRRIERDYREEIEQIEKRRRSSRGRIVREAEEDPSTLTKRIRDTFGIPIQE